jgi:uncharacterized protein involved in oxidation of intracellular sulfur
MKVLFIISTDEPETVYNAMRLANVSVQREDETSVFMLGRGVLYEKSSTDQFDVLGEVNKFTGDFMSEGCASNPTVWRDQAAAPSVG